MTAWQDQPPQSRRQLRLSERGDVHDDGARPQDSHVDVADSVDPSTQEQPTLAHSTSEQPVIEPPKDAFARPVWETAAESNPASSAESPTAESPTAPSHQPRSRAEAALASGRRSQHSFPHAVPAEPAPAPGAEPLNYFTQGRSQVPVYGGPSFGVNAVTPPPAEAVDSERPEGASGGYRIRDFSPESRRNAFSSTAEPAASAWNAPTASTDGHLDYYTQQGHGRPTTDEPKPERSETDQAQADQTQADQTQADQPTAVQPEAQHLLPGYPEYLQADSDVAAPADAEQAVVERAPAASVQPVTDEYATGSEDREPQAEHTMTRRELRAMREASAAATAEPIPLVVPVQPAAESPVPPVAQSWSIDAAEFPVSEQAEQTEPPVRAAGRFPFGLRAAQPEVSAPLQDPVPLRSPLAPAPQSSRELSDAMAEFDALMARDSDAVPIPETQGEGTISDIFQLDTSSDAGLVAGESELDGLEVDAPEADESKAGDTAGSEAEQDGHDGIGLFDSLLGGEPAIEAQSTQAHPVESQPVWPLAAELPTRGPGTVEHPVTIEQTRAAAPFDAAEASTDAVLSGDAAPSGDAVSAESVDPVGSADHHYVAPAGHWSRQAANSDEPEADGITLSRNIGATSGAVTANHLVMSSVPTVNDLLKPFSPTGEIMITGTIDLPRSMGTTGAHPARYDHSDVDTLLEASDREDTNVDSAPVRAIRAVSTHTSSRGLIGTGKPPRSSRLPMILAVSTAAVAAVVVVLFVAGLVLHVF